MEDINSEFAANRRGAGARCQRGEPAPCRRQPIYGMPILEPTRPVYRQRLDGGGYAGLDSELFMNGQDLVFGDAKAWLRRCENGRIAWRCRPLAKRKGLTIFLTIWSSRRLTSRPGSQRRIVDSFGGAGAGFGVGGSGTGNRPVSRDILCRDLATGNECPDRKSA